MEMDDLHTTKRSRLGSAANGGDGGWAYEPPASAVNIGDDKDNRGSGDVKNGEDGGRKGGGVRLHANWHQHASRICRVSRASGGKDRHSKVLTAKGLRDRRVRLSVSTAIQFYDLQDRLGVDQPSKAVEWLIKAASAAINELPALDGPLLEHPDQLMIEEKPGTQRDENDAAEEEDGDDGERNDYIDQQQQHVSLSKSACSSTSETSKGSVLSLSRSERPVRARGRAKARDSAGEKEKKERDEDDVHHSHDQDMHHHNHNSQSSFTELLTGGGGGGGGGHGHGSVTLAQAHTGDGVSSGAGFFPKQIRRLPMAAAATDYFSQAGLFGQGHKPHQEPGFPAQTHFGNSSSIGMMPFNAASAVATAGDHPEMQQQFSFLQDHVIPVAAVAASGEYSLNFSISSGLAGFNRGTLQSNSPSTMPHYHHLQRFSSPVDGSNLPFFLTTPGPAAPASGENHFPTGYDSRLQLCYGDGYRNTDLKGKGKG